MQHCAALVRHQRHDVNAGPGCSWHADVSCTSDIGHVCHATVLLTGRESAWASAGLSDSAFMGEQPCTAPGNAQLCWVCYTCDST